MVIRVRVGDGLQQPQPAAKRRRTPRGAANGCTYIKAHSVVLCSQSAYFDKCMEGEWTEAAEVRVEVTVPDEQAGEDLKLLIKLSYSDSYIHDESELLPLETRLRLGVLADGFEFVAAVEQVVE